MSDFCINEWNELCERTRRSAEHHSEKSPKLRETIFQECETFCSLEPPDTYPDFLKRTKQARDLAVGWMEEKTNRKEVYGIEAA